MYSNTLTMEPESLASPAEIPDLSLPELKEEVVTDTEDALSVQDVKEEVVIDTKEDLSFSEEIKPSDIINSSDGSKPCDTNNPDQTPPFTLYIEDEDGNVLEEYVQINGEMVRVKSSTLSQSPVPFVPPQSPAEDEVTLEEPRESPPKTSSTSSKSHITRKRRGRPPKPVVSRLMRLRETFKKKLYAKRHNMDEWLKNEIYVCKLCHSEFRGRKCFRNHLFHHAKTNSECFSCCRCEYSTTNRFHITRHMLQCHSFFQSSNNRDERFFACSMCDRAFFSNSDLKRHSYVHTGVKPFNCRRCQFSTFYKTAFDKHLVSHTTGYSLEARHRDKKYEEKKYECHHCGYKSGSKAHLTIHIEKHLGIYRFKCDRCDYSCSYKGDLTKHYTIHSNQKSFSCSTCLKKFKRRAHLLSHFKGKNSCEQEIKRKMKD